MKAFASNTKLSTPIEKAKSHGLYSNQVAIDHEASNKSSSRQQYTLEQVSPIREQLLRLETSLALQPEKQLTLALGQGKNC